MQRKREEMIGILTGDIINSRKSEQWRDPLKRVLNSFGASPSQWEIYRGDSFQVEIKAPEECLLKALLLKAAIKSVKKMDVRIGIGMGTKTYNSTRITECTGSAFIHSGEAFDSLKERNQTLLLKTGDQAFDEEWNLYFRLILIAIDQWLSGSAEFVRIALENPDLNQKEMGELLKIRQSSVSARYTRSHLAEILEVESKFKKEIKAWIQRQVSS